MVRGKEGKARIMPSVQPRKGREEIIIYSLHSAISLNPPPLYRAINAKERKVKENPLFPWRPY